jgi:hypothetical protein
MYQEVLHFEDDPAKVEALARAITGYFLNQDKLETWIGEGCLAIKLLIGLEQFRGLKDEHEQVAVLAESYADFVRKEWNGDGVGECFSTGVERTYGVSFESDFCTSTTTELTAKMAFYLSLLPESEAETFAGIRLTQLNDRGSDHPFGGWFDTVSELWVIKTYQQTRNRFVSAERFEATKTKFSEALKTADPAEPRAIQDALLVYGSLLAGVPLDPKMLDMLHALRGLQAKDGRIPSPFTVGSEAKSHNIDASPTYFYLLAVHELIEQSALLAECAP